MDMEVDRFRTRLGGGVRTSEALLLLLPSLSPPIPFPVEVENPLALLSQYCPNMARRVLLLQASPSLTLLPLLGHCFVMGHLGGSCGAPLGICKSREFSRLCSAILGLGLGFIGVCKGGTGAFKSSRLKGASSSRTRLVGGPRRLGEPTQSGLSFTLRWVDDFTCVLLLTFVVIILAKTTDKWELAKEYWKEKYIYPNPAQVQLGF
jgi:hypothetical protein